MTLHPQLCGCEALQDLDTSQDGVVSFDEFKAISHTRWLGWDAPLILTVLCRDYSTPYYNPYEGLLVSGGASQWLGL